MKRLFRIAMLVCVVIIFLSAWSLPSGVASANGQASQGHISLNADGKENLAPSPNLRGSGEFTAVAAISANDIWAVGDGDGTLIEHWNGTRWSVVKSPSPGTAFNNLYGVAAIASNDVWAVGSISNDPQNPNVETLIEHWNGSQWSIISSPSPGSGFNTLSGVVAIASNDVWAVGGYDFMTLIEHWDGTQWSVVSSPSPNNDAVLNGVAAISATNVWAVGHYFSSGGGSSGAGSQTLVEQWNGSQWSVITSANSQSQYNDLKAVAAVSANDIWAVGNINNFSQTLIEQWNGTQWSIVPSPNPGSLNDSLNAVAVVSAHEVWAVGGEEGSTGGERTLIEQWNGTQWNVIKSPSVGPGTNRLNGVAAISSSQAWAVGVSVHNAPFQTLTEQWNGTKWSVVISPNRIGNGVLAGVAAVSTSDMWAVGSDVSGALTENWKGTKWSYVTNPAIGSFRALSGVAVASTKDIWAVGQYANNSSFNTLTEHWNGTKWSVIASPNSMSQFNDLTGVAIASTNDVWAVGNSNAGFQTLIEHWNGSSWSIVSSPSPGVSGNSLNAVVAVSSSDVWAVGYQYNSSGDQQTLIEQWNGTQWNVVSSPSPGTFINDLTGVTALSASNIWVVGYHDGNSTVQTLVEHWNGTKWSVVTSPNGVSGSFLYSVAAASVSDIWAMGTYGQTFGVYQTLIEHWNGHKWSIVSSPNPGSANNSLNALTVVSPSDAWAVGEYSNNQYASNSLVVHWDGSTWKVVTSPNVYNPSPSRN